MRCCRAKGHRNGRGGPVGLMMTGVAALTAVVAFIIVAVVALAAVAVAAVAAVAYLKREAWTLPAYRWVRDQAGRWRERPETSAGTDLD